MIGKTVRSIVWILSIVVLVLTTACKPTIKITERPTSPPSGSSSGGSATQPTGGESQPVGETGTGGESDQAVSPSGVPADIPVMDEAYSLQVMRAGDNIAYKVDNTMDEVVTFYQEQMPGAGWQESTSPDTIVASIASLVRVNDAGDRVVINLQSNELGGFVTVSILVTRAK